MLGYDRLVKASFDLTLDPEKPKGEIVMNVDMVDRKGTIWTMKTHPWKIDRSPPKSANGKVPSFEDMSAVTREFVTVLSLHPFFKFVRCESPIELAFYFHAWATIKLLEPQVKVGPYRLDLAVPKKKVAIELDGHKHHSSRTDRTKDAARRRYLQSRGWRVIVFTGTEIYEDVKRCVEEAKEIINRRPNVHVNIRP